MKFNTICLELQDDEEQKLELIQNMLKNLILHSYSFFSIQYEQDQNNQIQLNKSLDLSIETQISNLYYFKERDEQCYAGYIRDRKPFGIWMINVEQYVYNKLFVSTIFLDFQLNEKAIIIEQGQIKLNHIKLMQSLKKKQLDIQCFIQTSEKELEVLAFLRLSLIYNSQEFNKILLDSLSITLNDFYFPKQNLRQYISLYPSWLPYFKQLRNNPDGSQAVCFGQYYKGQKFGEFFIKFRDNSDSEFQTIGGGQYNENGKKHGKWIHIIMNFSKSNQIIFQGEYVNGIKQLQWDTKYRQNSQELWKKIGGGQYDSKGRQVGNWIEQYNYLNFSEFLWNILYKNSKQNSELDLYFVESNGYFKQIQNYIYDDYQFSENKWINQNLELILNQKIFFAGQFNQGNRVGEWKILNQDTIIGGGSFDFNGLKDGKWTELIDIFQGQIIISQFGEYQNGKKLGKWFINWIEILKKNNKIIGGGNYDQYGIKQGVWQDLIEDFNEQKQITFKGNYKNGIRIGEWIIQAIKDTSNLNFIGQGQYNEKGLKIGLWREPFQNFKKNFQIYQSGLYNCGMKVGQWKWYLKKNLQHKKNKDDKFQDIGAGTYNEFGEKIGLWIELSENYREDSQIIFEGNYSNMKKTGKWITKYRYSESKDFKIIGGGNYDQMGVKCDLWEDVIENFSDSCQVIEKVQYQLGKKIGNTQFFFRKIHGCQSIQIGQGQYNQKGKKDGFWNELHDKFRDFCQVLKIGQYNDGIKHGDWTINFREFFDKEFTKIGGGQYDNGVKIGNWIDIDINQQYCRSRQMCYKVEYIKGLRVGNCEILYKNHNTNEFIVIGRGQYDSSGNKNGEWLEPHQNFWEHFQLYQFGNYKNGIKQGLWQISKDLQCQSADIIAGGTYDQGIKIKKWIDLNWNCLLSSYTLQEGEYSNGKRIGDWILKLKVYDETKIIGSCTFDEQGLKDGECIDLDQNFFFNKCAYRSTYIHGMKQDDSKEFSAR